MTDTAPLPVGPADWAGTTEDMWGLHRFTADKIALRDPAIRTYSSRRADDRYREPYMTLRSRHQIEATGFGHMYRFCPACAATVQPNQP